jgi:hypothetical protein
MRKCAAILGTNESMVCSALHPKVRKPKLKLPPPPKRPSTLPVKELRDHYCCPTPKFNPTWRQQAPELTHEDFIEAWKNTAKPPTPRGGAQCKSKIRPAWAQGATALHREKSKRWTAVKTTAS